MKILGISCYYHDASAAIVIDGKVAAAAAEERFTRIKHDQSFPENSIKFCLDWCGIKEKDIDAVVFYEKPIIKFERIISQHLASFPKSRTPFVKTIPPWIDERLNFKKTLKKKIGYTGPLYFIDQHLSHAASSYYVSPFKKSVIATFDGVGEWATTTIGIGNGTKIKIDKEINFPHSLGLFYSTLTAYLGFEVNDAEYKVMGLAAFGDPKVYKKHFDKLINIYPDGSYSLNMEYFDFVAGNAMPSRKMSALFGKPQRTPESVMDKDYENIAAALQKKLEEVVFNLLNRAYKKYKTENLCLAGGVALNSVLNGKILSSTPFKNLYIPPDPGDGGGAIGGALYLWNKNQKNKTDVSFSPFLGPAFSKEQIYDLILTNNLKFKYFSDERTLLGKTASLLSQKKIIGWFQGRMEWGPRALGNRSILASAENIKMKDIINLKVKHRELFRPFAPAILNSKTSKYFVADKNIPVSGKYMLLVYPVTDLGNKKIPAAVHVDGTGRLQIVERNENPKYYDLIKNYEKITGTPVIINTSFNVRGEPIVCTPTDAINCFLKTGIDYLIIDNFLVSK